MFTIPKSTAEGIVWGTQNRFGGQRRRKGGKNAPLCNEKSLHWQNTHFSATVGTARDHWDLFRYILVSLGIFRYHEWALALCFWLKEWWANFSQGLPSLGFNLWRYLLTGNRVEAKSGWGHTASFFYPFSPSIPPPPVAEWGTVHTQEQNASKQQHPPPFTQG